MPTSDVEALAARVASHDESLRAIGDTLVELKHDVRGLSRRMGRLERRVDGLQQTVDQHTATLDQHTVTLDQHTGMLTEILQIVRASAPDRPQPVAGEGEPPSSPGER
jgi:uncharacterized coiled-coil protein SlyX